MSIAERLRFGFLRAQHLVGTESLLQQLGKSSKQIARYFEGADFPFSFLQALSVASGIPLGWFAGEAIIPEGPEGRAVVPRYSVKASAGNGALVVSEDVSEYFSVGRDWLRRNLPRWAPPNAAIGILEGSGDSMEPTIQDGDLLMIVLEPTWEAIQRGGIFVLSVDGHLLLKRLQVLLNGDLQIISDNKHYAAETVRQDQLEHRVIVHGQVFFVGGRPRSLR